MCMHFFAKIMDVSKGQLTAVFKDCVALGALNYGDAQRICRRVNGTSASDISWWLTETAKYHCNGIQVLEQKRIDPYFSAEGLLAYV